MTRALLLTLALFVALNVLCDQAQGQQSALIPQSAAQRHGLKRAWYQQVDMDRARDVVESVQVVDGMVMVQTEQGVVCALDGETGRKIWSRRVGEAKRPTTSLGVGPSHVAVVNGANLYVLTRADGKTLWKKQLSEIVGAGPVVTATTVYVPTHAGTILAYSLSDPDRPEWRYGSTGHISVQPFKTDKTLSWPTDKGIFFVLKTEDFNPMYRFEGGGEMVVPPVYIKPNFFIGTLHGHVYKIDEMTGQRSWRFTTSSPINEPLLAAHDRVYIPTVGGGMYCVPGIKTDGKNANGRLDGEELWWAPKVTKLLSISPTRVYGLDGDGRLLTLRTDNGALIDSFYTRGLSVGVSNPENDRIYVGSKSGLIQCLHELALTKPVAHGKPVEAPKAEEEDEKLEEDGEDEDEDEEIDLEAEEEDEDF